MEPARVLANRYRLESVIGRGGMGTVYRAVDQDLERAVAIKLLGDGSNGASFERFLVEAKRTAAVRHPSIVEVFDVGRDGDDAFLVMELLEGETLEERVEQEPLSPAEAVAIGAQICDALAAAHDAGLVHRDLKPANVFLVPAAPGDAALRVKLLDFGIAKRIDGATARTDPSMIVGTIEYLSPEQIRGTRIDGRADLYALGMTLHRALTGELPFGGDNVAAFIHQHLSVPATSLRRFEKGVAIPPALDAAVLRLLAKEPQERPASARAAKRELLASLDRGSERTLDFQDDVPDAPSTELELELELDFARHAPAVSRAPAAARGPAIVPVAVPPPPALRGTPLVLARPTVPGWLEPLARVPEATSKRVAGYGLFVLVIYLVFFSGTLVPSLGLLAISVVGGIAYWARRRVSPDAPPD